MPLDGRIYIGASGPLIQYLKTFKKWSIDKELQPLRASPTMSFLQTCRFLEAGQGGGWGCGPEQLAATVPCVRVYSGRIAMAPIHNIIRRRTQLLGSPGALYLNSIILYIDIVCIITAIIKWFSCRVTFKENVSFAYTSSPLCRASPPAAVLCSLLCWGIFATLSALDQRRYCPQWSSTLGCLSLRGN